MSEITIYVHRKVGVWHIAYDAERQWKLFPPETDHSRAAQVLRQCLAEGLKLGQPFLDKADAALGVAFILRGRPD